MVDYTSRVKLEKAEDGEFADQDVLNRNFDKIDRLLGSEKVTSTSRPAAPFEGQIIYEEDTKKSATYKGGLGWVYLTEERINPFGVLRASQGASVWVSASLTRIPSWPDGAEGGMSATGSAPSAVFLKPNKPGLYRLELNLLGAGNVAGFFHGNAVLNNGTTDVHRIPLARLPIGPGVNGAYAYGVSYARFDANTQVYMDASREGGDTSSYLQGNSAAAGYNSSSETKLTVSWAGP